MARPKYKRWTNGVPRRDDSNFNRQLQGRREEHEFPANLPLVHITAAWPAQEILRSGKIQTKYCEVFSTDLLYFFVLRPAYRSKFGAEPSHQISRFPVVFVMKSEAVPPRHVYPFDTGGAAVGAFEKRADKFVPLEDYALEPTHSAVADFIGWAFGSLERYFEGRLRADIDSRVQAFESVVVSYVDIARMGVEGSNDHDKRASAVEVATYQNIDLLENLILTIVPKQLVEGNDELETLLRDVQNLGCDIRMYDWQPNRTPDEFQRDILEISREWYCLKGIMQ